MSNDINLQMSGIPADCHNHSTLSPDGCDAPEVMAQRAFELGIKHFTLTDHIENEKLGSWHYHEAMEQSYSVYLSLREQYKGRMEIYFGAELGQPLYDLPQAEAILARYDYDFVLGSQHRTRSYPYLDKVPDTDADYRRCLDEYFEELLELARWGEFCALSHLTFPLRFLCANSGRSIDISGYSSIIDEILGTIISKDIALEVNSSGIRKGLGVPMPSEEYLQRYFDKGGRLITLGSDAHRVQDVGADISKCVAILRKIGYNKICVFENKSPIFINI